jgi:pathogenesis-related protein 1
MIRNRFALIALCALAAVRTAVGAGIAPLLWDEHLAATAQTWADQCVDGGSGQLIGHNPNRSVGYAFYVGENIYASSGAINPQDVIDGWVSEQQHYHHATNTCDPGYVCGHYTQVIWSTSVLLGCGISHCPNESFPNSVVCDYGPGGNIIGVPPY